MRVHDDGCGHKHHGSEANTSQCKQATVSTVIQLIASTTLIITIIMLFVQVSVGMHSLVTKKIASEIEHLYLLHLCSATPLYCLLSQNLKPRKLILKTFLDFPQKLAPTSITRHRVFCTQLLWYYHKCLFSLARSFLSAM